uniref:Uncharacterized protein n=1 Tax=Proboscia inermis TaxID=420281 RepID=A0A7S0GEP7_9STRA|mmetsp:Transcript_27875/g.28279  ORF Transcript_27875/g.28279 Transcript_27875/m.28279 type:complete len:162 (+) Transcript_27875:402-887(+)
MKDTGSSRKFSLAEVTVFTSVIISTVPSVLPSLNSVPSLIPSIVHVSVPSAVPSTNPSLKPSSSTNPSSKLSAVPSRCNSGGGSETLVDLGWNPPCILGHCQGDCNNDSDCAPGLACYHRAGDDAAGPPGCSGTLYTGMDYCYVIPSCTAGGGSDTLYFLF